MQATTIQLVVRASVLSLMISLCACAVGPDYVQPTVQVPVAFKETDKHWKLAQPQDNFNRGEWWTLFNDPALNNLENQLNSGNQSIAAAAANYQQALALADQARASYFPTIAGSSAISRTGGGSNTATKNSAPGSSVPSASTNYSAFLTAAWEPDLWGGIRRSVEASRANAQASAAQLALTQLSSQASLAQYYFELRGVDADQRLLDNTVADYLKSLQLTQHQYALGVASRTDILQAQSQLEAAQAQAINNSINRALYEHAIAVLIGVPPAALSLPSEITRYSPPNIPLEVPSVMLERRPDIAQAERQVAQANAQIGVAEAAYFPTLDLTGQPGFQGNAFAHLFALPNLTWSVGAQLAQTLFDGGLRTAATRAAQANYAATVANYRQTVLTAFQEVEDNLATLRILDEETQIQNQAAASAALALKLVTNQYKVGSASYSQVIVAQTAAYAAEKNALDINYLRMSTAVALIKALGGGWDITQLKNPGDK